MRASFQHLFWILGACLSASAEGIAQPSSPGNTPHGITVADLQASYKRTVARHKHQLNHVGRLGTLQVLSVSDDGTGEESAPIVENPKNSKSIEAPKKRGEIIQLTAVGGYPKMLGQTYNAVAGAGTPAQLFNLTADTGSMLSWAVLESCNVKACPGSDKKHRFDPKKSSTVSGGTKDHEAYGDGEMDLLLYQDVIALGKLQINGTFGGATKTFANDANLERDGLLGLGRMAQNSSTDVLSAMRSASKEASDSEQVFALELGKSSQLEVGGFDYERYSKIPFFPVSADVGWTLDETYVSATGAAPVDGVSMLLDSGSSVTVMPESHLDAIMMRAELNAKKSKQEPYVYAVKCGTKLAAQLVLPNGDKLDIPDEDMLMQSNDPEMPGCLVLAVAASNPFTPAVVGTPILNSLYTVFRRGKEGDSVGIAPLLAK